MKVNIWLDWLRAQRRWCDIARAHYQPVHTPESVFLVFQRKPVEALQYTRRKA